MSHSDAGSTTRPLTQSRRSILQTTVGVATGSLLASSSAVAQETSETETDGTESGASVAFRFEPTTDAEGPPSDQTYDLVVSGAGDGLGAYEFTVESSDPSSVRITNVTLVAFGGQFSNIDIADDGSTAFIEEATGDASAPAETFTIARVTVTATDPASATALRVTNDARLQSADGSFYEISAFGNTTVKVNSASEIEANTPTESDTTANGTDAGQTTNGTEGLWILGGLAGLGSVGYVLAKRLRTQ